MLTRRRRRRSNTHIISTHIKNKMESRNRWRQTMLAAAILWIAIATVQAQDFQFETYPTDEVSFLFIFYLLTLFKFARMRIAHLLNIFSRNQFNFIFKPPAFTSYMKNEKKNYSNHYLLKKILRAFVQWKHCMCAI